jgi:hypothetical protein
MDVTAAHAQRFGRRLSVRSCSRRRPGQRRATRPAFIARRARCDPAASDVLSADGAGGVMRGAAAVTHRLGAGGWAERRGAAAETRFTSARVSRAWRDGRSCPGSGSLAPARARPIPLERSAVASPRQRGRRRSDAPRSAPMAPTTTMRDWRTRPGGIVLAAPDGVLVASRTAPVPGRRVEDRPQPRHLADRTRRS